MTPYNYERIDCGVDMRLKAARNGWSHYEVSFPSAFKSAYQEDNTVLR